MKKRILALTLAIVILSAFMIAVPVSAESNNDRINLLVDLGILKEISESMLVDQSFTRSDFAQALSMLDAVEAKLPVEAKAEEFAQDISKDANLAAIYEMLESHVMSAENLRFRPSTPITKNEAAQALVRILGYEPVAIKNGNTVSAYNMLATKLGLFKGLSSAGTEGLSYEEVGKMLYNAMTVPFYMPDDNIHPIERSFFDSWDLTSYTGVVLANGNLGLAVGKTKHGKVNIDNVLYDTTVQIDDGLIGCKVNFYTRLVNEKEIVVSVTPVGDSEAITLDADDIDEIKTTSTGFEIIYDEKEEIFIPRSAFMIVNGKTVSPTSALFNAFKSGTVTLVDSDGDGKFDLAHMTLLVWGIVEGTSSAGESLVVRTGGSFLKVSIDDGDSIEVYIGKKVANVSDIETGMVVGVGCDSYTITGGVVQFDFAHASVIKLYGSNRSDSGIVEMISNNEVYVNDMNFALSDAYFEFVTAGVIAPIQVGDGVVLYFDRYGKVVYYEMDPNATNMQYGYLINAGIENRALGSELLLKIMGTDGKINIYSTKDGQFILDSVKTDVQASSYVYPVGGESVDLKKRQLVRFLGQENVLRKLDTTVVRSGYEMKSGSLTQSNEFDFYLADQSTSKISAKSIDRRFVATNDCIVFVDEEYKDATIPNEKRFSVRGSDVLGDGRYHLAMFDASEMNEVPCFVYYKQYGRVDAGGESSRQSLSHNEYYSYVVEEVAMSVDKNGEPGWTLKVVGEGNTKTLFAVTADLQLFVATSESWNGSDRITVYERNPEQLASILSSGDLIRFTTTLDGTVNYIEKLFDFSDNKNTIYAVGSGGGTQHGFVNIERTTDESIMFTESATDTLLTNPDLTTYVFKKRSSNYNFVPVYNVRKGTASLYKYEDLPSISKGDKVKAFVRFYDYTWIFDYVFYLYE